MDGLACSACTLVNPPGALLCEACNAYLEGCAPCISSSEDESFLVTARRLWDASRTRALKASAEWVSPSAKDELRGAANWRSCPNNYARCRLAATTPKLIRL